MGSKLSIIGLFVVCVVATGCSNDGKDKSVNSKYTKDITKDTLSSDEVEFLTKNSFYEDNQSDLYDYQKGWIYRYRYALKTLKSRYPSYDFNILGGGDWYVASDDNFIFNLKNDIVNYDTEFFNLYMDKDGDDYVVRENFYWYVLHEKYENYLRETLSEIPLIGVYSSMSAVSSDFNEDSTVEDVIKSDAIPFNYLFVDGEVDNVTNIVENYIKGNDMVDDNFYIIPVEDSSLLYGLSSSEMCTECIDLGYFDSKIVINSNNYRKG